MPFTIAPAHLDEAPAISALNNLFAPDGFTLPRSPMFVAIRSSALTV